MYSNIEPGASVDVRFEQVSDKFRVFCSENKISCVLGRITKESIQWPTTGSFPSGGWHKGAITTCLMSWIEARHLLEGAEMCAQDPLFQLVGEACIAANLCLSAMFQSAVFLTPEESGQIGGQGMRFLRRYAQLVTSARDANRSLFAIMPKHHVTQKIFIALLEASQQGKPILNPISVSVQQDEDFIGRPSRLSRRVTARQPVMLRTMQRYLQAAYHKFIEQGYLVRPL